MNAQDILNDYDEKIIALAQHLDLDLDLDFDEEADYDTEEEKEEARQEAIDDLRNSIEDIQDIGDNLYKYGREEYNVYTDDEAEEAWENELDYYLEECVYPEIPERLRNYFDDEAWKEDARMDGRGHAISRYDGCEYEEKINGTWYFIYRQN